MITMSFNKAIKKLKSSKEFKKFKDKNKQAFMFSAFFVLQPDFSIENQQLDYYISKKKKVETFKINDKIEHKEDEFKPKDKIIALNENIKIDIPEIKKIIEKELEKEKLNMYSINKIIAILQKHKNKQIWNITCLLSGFKMLRLHVDCFSGKIIESHKGSMLDFIQIKSNK